MGKPLGEEKQNRTFARFAVMPTISCSLHKLLRGTDSWVRKLGWPVFRTDVEAA